MDRDASYLRAEEEEFDRLFTVLMLGNSYQHQNQPTTCSNTLPLEYHTHSDSIYPSAFNNSQYSTSGTQLCQRADSFPAYQADYFQISDCDLCEGGVAGNLDRIQFPDYYCDGNVYSGHSKWSSDHEDLELFKIPLRITEDLDNLRFDHSTDSGDLSTHCCQEDGGYFVDDQDLDGLLSKEQNTNYISTQDLTEDRRLYVKRSKSLDFLDNSHCVKDYSGNIYKSVTMDHMGLGDTIRMNTIKLANFRRSRDWASQEGNNNTEKSDIPPLLGVSSPRGDRNPPSGDSFHSHQRYVGIKGVTTTSSTDDNLGSRVPAAGWNRDKKPAKETGLVDNLLGFMRRTPKRDSKTKLKRYSWSPGFTSTSNNYLPVPNVLTNQTNQSTAHVKQTTRPMNLTAITPQLPLPDISVISEIPVAMNSRLSSGDGFIFTQDVRSSRKPSGNDNPAYNKVPSKRHSCSSEIMRAARSDTLERLKKDSLRYGLKNKLWESGDKLLLDLLDDLDDISAAGPDARRRKKARDLFADWLFSDGTPTTPQASEIAKHKRHNRYYFNDFLLQQGMLPIESSCVGAQHVSSGLELPLPPLENFSCEVS